MRFEPTPLRSFTFGFSVVSLFLLPVWRDLFSRRGAFFESGFLANHHQISASAQLDYLAGMLVMAAFTLVLGGALAGWGRRSPKWAAALAACITAGLVLYGLNVMRVWYMPWASLAHIRSAATAAPVVFALAATAGVGIVGFVVSRTLGQLTTLVMLGLPIGLIILFNATGSMVVLGGNGVRLPAVALAPRSGGEPAVRVAWIIFDEADYRLLFESPPKGLVLAAFDRLRGQGLDASGAVSPFGSTLPSIPALISGRELAAAAFTSAGAVARLRGEPVARPWRDLPSVFAAVHDKGLNAAALGQDYIPYCRSFHTVLAACTEMGAPWRPAGATAISHVGDFLARVAAYIPLLNRHVGPELFDSGMAYRRFLRQVMNALSDPGLALVYAHWNLPHAPYVYDRSSQTFIKPTEAPARYFDNGALADRMLGDMMKELEASGLAAKTAVIVTSDHHWRRSQSQYDGITDYRVPFVVRVAGDRRRVAYTRPFNTIVTKDLVLAILDGRVRTNQDAARFIGRYGVPPGRSRSREGK